MDIGSDATDFLGIVEYTRTTTVHVIDTMMTTQRDNSNQCFVPMTNVRIQNTGYAFYVADQQQGKKNMEKRRRQLIAAQCMSDLHGLFSECVHCNDKHPPKDNGAEETRRRRSV